MPCGCWAGDRRRLGEVSHSALIDVVVCSRFRTRRGGGTSCEFVIVELDLTRFSHGILELNGWVSYSTVLYSPVQYLCRPDLRSNPEASNAELDDPTPSFAVVACLILCLR